MYFDNLFDNDFNNIYYKLNEYQNTKELYIHVPLLEFYNNILNKNNIYKQKIIKNN